MKKVILTIMMLLSLSSFCFASPPADNDYTFTYVTSDTTGKEFYVVTSKYFIKDDTAIMFMIVNDKINCAIMSMEVIANTKYHEYIIDNYSLQTKDGESITSTDNTVRRYSESSPVAQAIKILVKKVKGANA